MLSVVDRGWLEHCGVTRREVENFDRIDLPGDLRGWPDGDSGWALTLLGPTGCGKTWTAIEVLLRLREPITARTGNYRPARFLDAVEFVDDLRADLDAAHAAFERAAAIPLLILDDVGAGRSTDYSDDRISTLLRKRYNRSLLTVVTSNAPTLKALSAGLDPRICSRLAGGTVVTLRGQDRRPRRATGGAA